jgi:hypothetical protein
MHKSFTTQALFRECCRVTQLKLEPGNNRGKSPGVNDFDCKIPEPDR